MQGGVNPLRIAKTVEKGEIAAAIGPAERASP